MQHFIPTSDKLIRCTNTESTVTLTGSALGIDSSRVARKRLSVFGLTTW